LSVEDQLKELTDSISRLSVSSTKRFQIQLNLISFLAENGLRLPQLVVSNGMELLKSHSRHLAEQQKWNLYERVFIAALDADDPFAKKMCLEALTRKFPTSERVKRLIALQFESSGNFTQAKKLYEKMLQDDPTNAYVWKRKVAVLKAEGSLSGAIEELCKYLDVFSADQAGWEELCQMYMTLNKFDLAKFCVEELILLVPEHYIYHLQYADLLYTIGGKANIEMARQYYSQSLELKSENNLRALYGIILCIKHKTVGASTISNKKLGRNNTINSTNTSEENTEKLPQHLSNLYQFAVNKITHHYQQTAPQLLTYVQETIQL